MKKLWLIISTALLFLVSCQAKEVSITILVPDGIPSIAQSELEYQENGYTIDRIAGPQPLSAAFTSGSYDVIIAPINLGANLYQKGAEYRLAGILTWSNLQIISRVEINQLNDLSGQDIISFGQGAIPEIVISHLLSQITFDEPISIDYTATSVQESLLMFLQGADYAIVSEPITSQVLDLEDTVYIYDLADAWSSLTGFESFPQAGVFVHNNLTDQEINIYLSDLEDASNLAINHPDDIAEKCASMDYPFESSLIEISLPKSHIDFQTSSQAQVAINQMLQLIYEEKPALIGDALPDDDWLYLPS
jgi:NitT/TauT family transport system substrate-binding protein